MKWKLFKWAIKDWVAKKQGLYPFYSYYVAHSSSYVVRESRETFNGHWELILYPEDAPKGYPEEQIRRHVETILPPCLD